MSCAGLGCPSRMRTGFGRRSSCSASDNSSALLPSAPSWKVSSYTDLHPTCYFESERPLERTKGSSAKAILFASLTSLGITHLVAWYESNDD
jgi:hypothetical protein